MSLDPHLPAYAVREVHSLAIDAVPERVIKAAGSAAIRVAWLRAIGRKAPR